MLLSALLVGGLSYYFSALATPVYRALVILQIEEGIDPQRDPYTSLLTIERSAKTYAEMLKGTAILSKVVETLELPFGVSKLRDMVIAQQIRETQLIKIQVEDSIPLRAREIANKIADAFIAEMRSRQKASFDSGKAELDTQIASLEKRMEETQAAMVALGNPRDPRNVNVPEFARLELMRLENILTRDRALYVMLLRSAEDFRLAEVRSANSFSVASYAELPSSPVSPLILFNTVFGATSGLLLGIIASALLDYMDNTIKTGDDVTQALGLSTLGNIVRVKGIKRFKDGVISNVSQRSPLVEAYRILRTNIEFAGIDSPMKAILVTSPSPGEGKTTICANLGIVIAQAGKKVIIVDADLRRPSLHRLFEVSNNTGLTTLLLQDGLRPGDVLLETGVPSLSILTSGPIPPNPSELLGSDRMARLLEELKEGAEVVILDSPPVLAVTDANVLASRVDGGLLVLDAGATRVEEGQRAVEALGHVGARILGVVLNRYRVRDGGYYYYYYYSGKGGRKEGRPEKPVVA